MFERFTDRARRVVVTAQEEARMLGHNHIGSEHLLLGLLHAEAGAAAHVLAAGGITVEAARTQVQGLTGSGSSKSPSGHIPFTQRARKVLELSLREALEQRQRFIGTEHILLALLRDSGDVGAQVLERLGGSLPALRQQVLDEVKSAAPDPAEAEDGPEHGNWEWPPAQGFSWEGPAQPQTVVRFRGLLEPIDRRLAGIERHLGVAADEDAPVGFRGLARSVDRRLANIERHLGIAAGEGAEKPGQAAEE